MCSDSIHWAIGEHPKGGWGVQSWNPKSDNPPNIRVTSKQFKTFEEAYDYIKTEQDSPSLNQRAPISFDDEPDLCTAIGVAMGFVSACWSNLSGAGEFQSELASEACENIKRRVKLVEEERDLLRKRLNNQQPRPVRHYWAFSDRTDAPFPTTINAPLV